MRKILFLFVAIGLVSCKKNSIEPDGLYVECENCKISYSHNPEKVSQNKGMFDIKGSGYVPYVETTEQLKLGGSIVSGSENVKIMYKGVVIYNGVAERYPSATLIEYTFN